MGAKVICVVEKNGTTFVCGNFPSRKKCKHFSNELTFRSSSISLSCHEFVFARSILCAFLVRIIFSGTWKQDLAILRGDSGVGTLLVVGTRNSIGTIRPGMKCFGGRKIPRKWCPFEIQCFLLIEEKKKMSRGKQFSSQFHHDSSVSSFHFFIFLVFQFSCLWLMGSSFFKKNFCGVYFLHLKK